MKLNENGCRWEKTPLKKKLTHFFFLIAVVVLIVGCEKKEPPPVKFLSIDGSALTVGFASGSQEIAVQSNTRWTVSSDADWLTTSITSGEGNAEVNVLWNTLENSDQREGNIIFKTTNISRSFHVTQTLPIKLISQEGVIGNDEIGVKDSIILFFNVPVVVKSIIYGYDLCDSEHNYVVKGNRVSFAYTCATIGRDYPFTISVQDNYSFQFKIFFYSKKLSVPGFVMDFFISDDNKTIWAITRNPNQIVKVSLPDLSLVATHPLDFMPRKIYWNNYHNQLTIFNFWPTDSIFRFVDPVSFNTKNIVIKPIKPYESPRYSPFNLCTMNDGTGILHLWQAGYNRWRFVDKNDSTFLAPSQMNYSGDGYRDIFLNFDGTSIIMMQPDGSPNLDIWKMGSSSFQTYTSPYNDIAHTIVTNKKNNLVYHQQLYEQFISDLNGYVSALSIFDTRAFLGNAAFFSYREGEDKIIYYYADGTLYVLDYQNALTNLSTKIDESLYQLQPTTDGKNLIGYFNNSTTSDFCLLDINSILTNATQNGSRPGGRIRLSNVKSVWKK